MMYDLSREERQHRAIGKENAPVSLIAKACKCGARAFARQLAQHGKCEQCCRVATLEPGDLEMLQFMLGVQNLHKTKWGTRNHYLCNVRDRAAMLRLVAAGLAVEGAALLNLRYYHATINGCRAAGLDTAGCNRAAKVLRS